MSSVDLVIATSNTGLAEKLSWPSTRIELHLENIRHCTVTCTLPSLLDDWKSSCLALLQSRKPWQCEFQVRGTFAQHFAMAICGGTRTRTGTSFTLPSPTLVSQPPTVLSMLCIREPPGGSLGTHRASLETPDLVRYGTWT